MTDISSSEAYDSPAVRRLSELESEDDDSPIAHRNGVPKPWGTSAHRTVPRKSVSPTSAPEISTEILTQLKSWFSDSHVADEEQHGEVLKVVYPKFQEMERSWSNRTMEAESALQEMMAVDRERSEELQATKHMLETKDLEILKLNSQVVQLRNSSADGNSAELENQLHDVKVRWRASEDELKAARSALTELQLELTELRGKGSSKVKDADYALLQQELERLQQIEQAAQERTVQLVGDLDKSKSLLKETERKWLQCKEQLAEAEERQQSVGSLRATDHGHIQTLQLKLEQIESERNTLRERLAAVTEALQVMEEQKVSEMTLMNEMDSIRKSVEEERATLLQEKRQIQQSYETYKADAEAELKSVRFAYQDQINQLEEQQARKGVELAKLTQRLTNLEASQGSETVKELRAQLEAQGGEFEGERAAWKESSRMFREQLEAQQAELARILSKVSESTELETTRRQEVEQQVEDMRRTLGFLKEENATLIQLRQTAESKVETVTTELGTMRAQMRKVQDEVGVASRASESELGAKEAELQRLEGELARARAESERAAAALRAQPSVEEVVALKAELARAGDVRRHLDDMSSLKTEVEQNAAAMKQQLLETNSLIASKTQQMEVQRMGFLEEIAALEAHVAEGEAARAEEALAAARRIDELQAELHAAGRALQHEALQRGGAPAAPAGKTPPGGASARARSRSPPSAGSLARAAGGGSKGAGAGAGTAEEIRQLEGQLQAQRRENAELQERLDSLHASMAGAAVEVAEEQRRELRAEDEELLSGEEEEEEELEGGEEGGAQDMDTLASLQEEVARMLEWKMNAEVVFETLTRELQETRQVNHALEAKATLLEEARAVLPDRAVVPQPEPSAGSPPPAAPGPATSGASAPVPGPAHSESTGGSHSRSSAKAGARTTRRRVKERGTHSGEGRTMSESRGLGSGGHRGEGRQPSQRELEALRASYDTLKRKYTRQTMRQQALQHYMLQMQLADSDQVDTTGMDGTVSVQAEVGSSAPPPQELEQGLDRTRSSVPTTPPAALSREPSQLLAGGEGPSTPPPPPPAPYPPPPPPTAAPPRTEGQDLLSQAVAMAAAQLRAQGYDIPEEIRPEDPPILLDYEPDEFRSPSDPPRPHHLRPNPELMARHQRDPSGTRDSSSATSPLEALLAAAGAAGIPVERHMLKEAWEGKLARGRAAARGSGRAGELFERLPEARAKKGKKGSKGAGAGAGAGPAASGLAGAVERVGGGYKQLGKRVDEHSKLLQHTSASYRRVTQQHRKFQVVHGHTPHFVKRPDCLHRRCAAGDKLKKRLEGPEAFEGRTTRQLEDILKIPTS